MPQTVVNPNDFYGTYRVNLITNWVGFKAPLIREWYACTTLKQLLLKVVVVIVIFCRRGAAWLNHLFHEFVSNAAD